MARRHIGQVVAPLRFLLFVAVTAVSIWLAPQEVPPRFAVMLGFDTGALVFLLSSLTLLRHEAGEMRESARRNDANRVLLLFVSAGVVLVILVAIASELMEGSAPRSWALALVVATLLLAWTFSNTIFALHYAHLFYSERCGGDAQGLDFPETPEPDYWDFIYFAFCLGMTFQTSDVTVTHGKIRRVVTLHCVLAFVFNLGVLAFTINVLGGG